MLVGLCGPAKSGKSSVARYFVEQLGFTRLDTADLSAALSASSAADSDGCIVPAVSMISKCWRSNINVVIDEVSPIFHNCDGIIPELLKRPYFFLIYVDSDPYTRWLRTPVSVPDFCDFGCLERVIGQCYTWPDPSFGCKETGKDSEEQASDNASADNENDNETEPEKKRRKLLSLNEMATRTEYRGQVLLTLHPAVKKWPTKYFWMKDLEKLSRFQIVNDFSKISELNEYLAKTLPFDGGSNAHILRPSWDSYFTSIANLTSKRSNCMRRRVGCVIVKDRRIISSGYNGTPSGVKNCSDGGCARCNDPSVKASVRDLDLCMCLHAEENAIIEAGRERCKSATLYSTLFPCTLCAKKIIQAGIARVVFANHYAGQDEASTKFLKAGQVIIDQHNETE